jgi:hypothetical protein
MRCRTLIPTSVVLVTAVSLLAAGCGSSSPTHASTTQSTPNGALAYAQCMRSHGVSNFPDPSSSGAAPKPAIVSALKAVGTSRSQTASTACEHVNGGGPGTATGAEQGPARTRVLLAFAQCLRHHGFVNFPDPGTNGELTQAMLAAAGINLHTPGLKTAADTCATVTHGVITKATVARFVAGQ